MNYTSFKTFDFLKKEHKKTKAKNNLNSLNLLKNNTDKKFARTIEVSPKFFYHIPPKIIWKRV